MSYGTKVSSFRDRFIELLDSSPKSRSTIAQEFGVAKQTISAWATGQSSPRLPVVTALAEYFGVELGWLLGYDVSKRNLSGNYISAYVKLPEDPCYEDPADDFTPDELSLIDSYRALSRRGQELLLDRAEELKLLHGKKEVGAYDQSE